MVCNASLLGIDEEISNLTVAVSSGPEVTASRPVFPIKRDLQAFSDAQLRIAGYQTDLNAVTVQ